MEEEQVSLIRETNKDYNEEEYERSLMLAEKVIEIELSKPQQFGKYIFGLGVGFIATQFANKAFDVAITAYRQRKGS